MTEIKLIVICEQCFWDEEEIVEMIAIGPMAVNVETHSQTQKYECRSCNQQVSVIMEITND